MVLELRMVLPPALLQTDRKRVVLWQCCLHKKSLLAVINSLGFVTSLHTYQAYGDDCYCASTLTFL